MPPGPPIHRSTPIHRVEHGIVAVAILAVIVYVVLVLDATTWWPVAFWAIAPDLVFLPIGLASAFTMRKRDASHERNRDVAAAARRSGDWPSWGVHLYNAAHTYVVMLPAFAVASLLQGHVVWPLLAWALHIEIDRAVGFDLRLAR